MTDDRGTWTVTGGSAALAAVPGDDAAAAQTGPRRAAGTSARLAAVTPIGEPAERRCARPGCSRGAFATLGFSYATREAWIEALTDESQPSTYDLCADHAARTRPPHGWRLRDLRRAAAATTPAPRSGDGSGGGGPGERGGRSELGGAGTVAVLAAALRAHPHDDPPPEIMASERDPAPERASAPRMDRSPRPVLAARDREAVPPSPPAAADGPMD